MTIAAAIAAFGVALALLLNIDGDPRSVEVTPADPSPSSVPSTGESAVETEDGATQGQLDSPLAFELDSSVDTGGGATSVEGDGVPLEFIPVRPPSGESLELGRASNRAFRGEVYAAGRPVGTDDGEFTAYRTSNGFEWEPVDGFNELDLPKGEGFATAEERIVNVALETDITGVGLDTACSSDDAVIHVHTSTDGDVWRSSRIEEVIPSDWHDLCVWLTDVQVATGPTGVLLLAGVAVTVDDDALRAQAEFDGPGVEPTLDFATARQLYDELTGSQLDENGGATLAWWSADGTSWAQAPLSAQSFGGGFSPVAGHDGFYLFTTLSGSAGVEATAAWRTIDGSSWERVVEPTAVPGGSENPDVFLGVTEWRDEIVTLPSYRRLDGTGPVLPAGLLEGQPLFPMLEIGEFGALALGDGGRGTVAPAAGGGPMAFTDDNTWTRWMPSEPLGEYEVLGIGADFVLLAQRSDGDDDGVDEPLDMQRLWIGRLPS